MYIWTVILASWSVTSLSIKFYPDREPCVGSQEQSLLIVLSKLVRNWLMLPVWTCILSCEEEWRWSTWELIVLLRYIEIRWSDSVSGLVVSRVLDDSDAVADWCAWAAEELVEGLAGDDVVEELWLNCVRWIGRRFYLWDGRRYHLFEMGAVWSRDIISKRRGYERKSLD